MPIMSLSLTLCFCCRRTFTASTHSGPPMPITSLSWPGGLPQCGLSHVSPGSPLPLGWQLLPHTDLQMMALYNVPFMATHALLNPRVSLFRWDHVRSETRAGVTILHPLHSCSQQEFSAVQECFPLQMMSAPALPASISPRI